MSRLDALRLASNRPGRMAVHRLIRLVACTLAVGLLVTACGRDGSATGGDGGESGATAFPFDTAQDWVTYADYVVEVTVVSEQAIPTPASTFPATARGPAPTSNKDDYVGRLVAATTSTPPVWTRPTLSPSRHLPATLTLGGGGWVGSGAHRRPATFQNRMRPEIGHDYLAAISYANLSWAAGDGSGSAEWLTLTVLPFDDGVIGKEPAGSEDPMWTAFEGMRAAEVAAFLGGTPADPAAAPYMDEDPAKRYQDVARDTMPTGTPAPGEY